MSSEVPEGLSESFQPIIGAAVTIRPLRPDDVGIEREFLTGLSPATRHSRLLGGAIRITDEYIRRLTHLDWSREAALAAIVMLDETETIIGVARYAVDPGGGQCEFAIVIADTWQRLGIGRRMLEKLIAVARRRGLERMYGDTLATNEPMLALARKLGFSVARHPGDTTLTRVTLELGDRATA